MFSLKDKLFVFTIAIVLAILLILFLVIFLFCESRETIEENIEQYLVIRDNAKSVLNDSFQGMLPKKENIHKEGAEYKYYQIYENFYIRFSHQYADKAEYQNEVSRISLLANRSVIVNETETIYYALPADDVDFDRYFDDQGFDGCFLRFEFAITNGEDRSIEYVSASLDDVYCLVNKDDRITYAGEIWQATNWDSNVQLDMLNPEKGLETNLTK